MDRKPPRTAQVVGTSEVGVTEVSGDSVVATAELSVTGTDEPSTVDSVAVEAGASGGSLSTGGPPLVTGSLTATVVPGSDGSVGGTHRNVRERGHP